MKVTHTKFTDVYVLEPDVCEDDRGIRWNDPELSIDWPAVNPHLSVKDQQLPFLNEAELPSA